MSKRMKAPCRGCDERSGDCRTNCIAWKIYEAANIVWRKDHEEEWRKRQPQYEYDHNKNDKIKKLRDKKERR